MRTDFLQSALTLLVSGLLMQSCDTKMYEDCPADRIVGEWGVVDHTRTFGEYDSLYYIVNPIGNINDSIYYNGNYTDSYYHSDPVRVMLKYTLQDSIYFNLDRLYSTETNPRNILMTVKGEDKDSADSCVLHLRREENNENLYAAGPDLLFRELLEKEGVLHITATNGTSSSEPQGSQNYEFKIFTSGFKRALDMADSLNRSKRAAPEAKKKDDGSDTKKLHP